MKKIMKLKLFSTISAVTLMASALFFAACSDDDNAGSPSTAYKTIKFRPASIAEGAEVNARMVSQLTLSLNNMVTINPAVDITLNGTKVTVTPSDATSMEMIVTLPAMDRGQSYTLTVPEGAFIGQLDKTALSPAYTLTFTTKSGPKSVSNEATEFLKKLGWGWNLGNHFDTSNTEWGYWDGVNTIDASVFTGIAAAGAKTVRIPVTWTSHMTDNIISADYLNEVAAAVDKALAAGLYVILNSHHDSFETELGSAATNQDVAKQDSAIIVELWKQVATKFKDYNEKLIFETFNEIHDGDNWSSDNEAQLNLLNVWNQYAVDAIRATGAGNATRWIGIPGYAASPKSALAATFQLPTDPANRLMVSAHFYDPSNFTLSPEGEWGVSEWGHTATPGNFVEDCNEDYVEDTFIQLQQKFIANNIPVYIGEYGCVMHSNDRSNLFRNYYLEYVCRAAHDSNLPVCIWDNNAVGSGNEKHGYFSHSDGSWLNNMEQLVKAMIQAATTDDATYDLDNLYNNAPE